MKEPKARGAYLYLLLLYFNIQPRVLVSLKWEDVFAIKMTLAE